MGPHCYLSHSAESKGCPAQPKDERARTRERKEREKRGSVNEKRRRERRREPRTTRRRRWERRCCALPLFAHRSSLPCSCLPRFLLLPPAVYITSPTSFTASPEPTLTPPHTHTHTHTHTQSRTATPTHTQANMDNPESLPGAPAP